MKNNFRTAVTVGTAIMSLAVQLACHAQNTTSHSDESALTPRGNTVLPAGPAAELIASAKGEQPVDLKAPPAAPASSAAAPGATPAAADSSAVASAAATAAANPPATVVPPTSDDAVIKELAEMKARIAQLEADLKAHSGANRRRGRREETPTRYALQRRPTREPDPAAQ